MHFVSRDNFIDRVAEEELFTSLLQFQTAKRVLVVNDNGGRGKSHLLKRLAYVCEWEQKPAIPVSRVEIDKLNPTPITLLEHIRKDLDRFKLKFEQFDHFNDARIDQNQIVFGRGPVYALGNRAVQGEVNAPGMTVHAGGTVGGIVAPQLKEMHVHGQQWTGAMEQRAVERCAQAFLEDLAALASEQPVVILLDAVDSKANDDLKVWVLDELAMKWCLNNDERPKHLILVLSGRDSFGFTGIGRFEPLIESIKSLSTWEKEHVKKFLELNGCEGASDQLIELVTDDLKKGTTLLGAVEFAKSYMAFGGIEGLMKRLREGGD